MDSDIKAYKEALEKRKGTVPIWEKKCLTIKEAAAYSGIGQTKLRAMAKEKGCPFAMWQDKRIYIVREKLDEFTDKQFRI